MLESPGRHPVLEAPPSLFYPLQSQESPARATTTGFVSVLEISQRGYQCRWPTLTWCSLGILGLQGSWRGDSVCESLPCNQACLGEACRNSPIDCESLGWSRLAQRLAHCWNVHRVNELEKCSSSKSGSNRASTWQH